MRIYALHNSELEKLFQDFYDKMKNDEVKLKDMVKNLTDIEPINMSYNWEDGITCLWSYETLRFDKNETPNNVCKYTMNGLTYYKPNKRFKKSKLFIKEWQENFKGIDGSMLFEYGIPVYDKNKNLYFNWLPCKKDNSYGIIVSSQILRYMSPETNKNIKIEI